MYTYVRIVLYMYEYFCTVSVKKKNLHQLFNVLCFILCYLNLYILTLAVLPHRFSASFIYHMCVSFHCTVQRSNRVTLIDNRKRWTWQIWRCGFRRAALRSARCAQRLTAGIWATCGGASARCSASCSRAASTLNWRSATRRCLARCPATAACSLRATSVASCCTRRRSSCATTSSCGRRRTARSSVTPSGTCAASRPPPAASSFTDSQTNTSYPFTRVHHLSLYYCTNVLYLKDQ